MLCRRNFGSSYQLPTLSKFYSVLQVHSIAKAPLARSRTRDEMRSLTKMTRARQESQHRPGKVVVVVKVKNSPYTFAIEVSASSMRDVQGQTVLRDRLGGDVGFRGIHFTSDGFLISISDDGTFIVWDITQHKRQQIVFRSSVISASPLATIACDPLSCAFAIGDAEGEVLKTIA